MEHPDPAPMQESSQPMGQAEDPPDETTAEALQTTSLTACRGVGLTVGSTWTGEEWECKNREKMIKGSNHV